MIRHTLSPRLQLTLCSNQSRHVILDHFVDHSLCTDRYNWDGISSLASNGLTIFETYSKRYNGKTLLTNIVGRSERYCQQSVVQLLDDTCRAALDEDLRVCRYERLIEARSQDIDKKTQSSTRDHVCSHTISN